MPKAAVKSVWNANEAKIFRRLNRPEKIQDFLDALTYNTDDKTRSPREVLAIRRAHCFDGAMLAAAALEFHGEPPLLLDLRSNHEDDDHVLALFKRCGCWGAIAKSNYTGCRFRDPVYRNLRELVMSYFDTYFNLAGKKTLREYSVPFDLRKIKDIQWRVTSDNLDPLGIRLDDTRHFSVMKPILEKHLMLADDRSFRAATLGLNPAGAHKVKNSRL